MSYFFKYNNRLSFLFLPRVVIENTFGLLKRRWRRLDFILVRNLETMGRIIEVCCILHNFCMFHNDYLEEIANIPNHSTIQNVGHLQQGTVN